MNLRALAPLALVVAALLVVGCGGSGNSDATAPSADSAAPISSDALTKLKPRMSREEVVEAVGTEPVLTQSPTERFREGCVFFRMEKQPLANVLQVCFDDLGLSLVVTALSGDQPAPPDGASDARAALLARGDSICQSEYGLLRKVTSDLKEALQEFGSRPSAANREHVSHLIGRFIENLDRTQAQLAAFDAPEDEIEALTDYLEALDSQIAFLQQAKRAFGDGDLDAYDELGGRFTETGLDAKQFAREYGFSFCSASGWS